MPNTDIFTSLASHWKLTAEPGSNFLTLGKVEYVGKNVTGENGVGAVDFNPVHLGKHMTEPIICSMCLKQRLKLGDRRGRGKVRSANN